MANKSDEFKFEIEHQSNILIKAENKEQKERAIIMLIVLTATFVMTILSLVFSIKAYNATKETQKKEAEKNETYYQTLITAYSDSPQINISNLTTGYTSNTKRLTINNDGDYEIIFNIKLTSITTNLLSTNSLVYSLVGNGSNITKELPLQESTLLSDISIEPGQTIQYTFDIKFNGIIDSPEPVYNYNATFLVEQNNSNSSLLER